MRKITAILLVAVFCVGALAGCCLKHEWKEADCEQPRQCIECGKTQGEALGHQWNEATCEEPKTCAECKETEGKALGHSWEGEICARCAKVKDNISCRESYTDEEDKVRENADTVVAVMGDWELTNSELVMYYRAYLADFYYQNGYYLSVLGLDPSQPLDQQVCGLDTTMTWEQFFLNQAIQMWTSYAALEIMAQRDQYILSDEQMAELDAMEKELAVYAEVYGYDNVEAYLEAMVGPGADTQTYTKFNTSGHLAANYTAYFCEVNKPTDEQIQTYAQQNADKLMEMGITPQMGRMGDVRHILIQPQDGTTDASTGMTTYSEAQWAAALAEAEGILKLWKENGATEEKFAELVAMYSTDGGSVSTGGLYQNVCDDGTYVPSFTAWAVDPVRQAGDTGIVQTEYGYHIMYFVEGRDWFQYKVSDVVTDELFRQQMEQIRLENPVEVFYREIRLTEVILSK